MAVKRKVFGSIGVKILLWFLILSITPAATITFISYWRSTKLVKEQLAGLLDRTAEWEKEKIYDFLTAKKAKLINFAADGLIRDGIVAIYSEIPGKGEIGKRLNHHLSTNKVPLDQDIIEAFAIDLHGKVVTSSNETRVGMNVSNEDYFSKGWMRGIYVSDLQYPATAGDPVMVMSRVMTDTRTGDPIGIMVITIRGNSLSNLTRSWNDPKDKSIPSFRGIGRTGEVYIVNEDHLMVTESRFVENAAFRQVVSTEPVKRAFLEYEEFSGVYLNYMGVKVFGTSRLIDEPPCLIIAEKHLSEVFEPINGLRNVGIGLGIIDALVVLIIAFFITRSLTNPIHKLVTATEKVAKGDLNYRILTTSKDEIGQLSNSFNQMIHDLRNSRGELRALFDDGIDAMFILGNGEKITDVNESACTLLGLERNALIGINISDLIGNNERVGKKKMVAEAITRTWMLQVGGKPPTINVSLSASGGKEGGEILCELDLKRIEYGIYAVFRDVTMRKHLEQAIADEKQRLDDIVSEIGAGLSLVDRDLKIIWINKTQSDWFGSLKDVQGKPCYSVYWNNKEACQGCPTGKTFVTGAIEKALHLYIAPNSEQKWYNITSSPVKDRTGQVTHVLELIEDVTQEKQAEEEFKRLHESVVQANIKLEQSIRDLKFAQRQLIQAEKMASMGQLAASVAHEINNPLSYVDNNLDILTKYLERVAKFLKKCEEGKSIFEKGETAQMMTFFKEVQDLKKAIKLDFIFEDFGEVIKESKNGVEQVKRIVSNLSTFSHVGEDLPVYGNLNKIIESILPMVGGELRYKAEVIKEYGNIPEIKCYPQQLGQVFMNLLLNAAHSIEGRGKIWIKTYRAENNICVEVKDRGKGMPEEILSRIFEPFFTTKEPGKGTGLGLTVASNIIQKHFGKIEVSSKVGEGTTFTIVLPIRE